jgi:hypothetical protein
MTKNTTNHDYSSADLSLLAVWLIQNLTVYKEEAGIEPTIEISQMIPSTEAKTPKVMLISSSGERPRDLSAENSGGSIEGYIKSNLAF